MEVYLYVFLNSALDGGKWSVSRSGRLTLRERAAGAHSEEGWGTFSLSLYFHFTHKPQKDVAYISEMILSYLFSRFYTE
jgi:hypothetical protein